MNLSKICKNTFLIVLLSLVLTACATQKKVDVPDYKTIDKTIDKTIETTGETTDIVKVDAQILNDVYVGSESVEYLAKGVPDRVFFATNESILTTASRETLRKQAAWLRENSGVTVVIEGHADERGTREYNLALGERRANAAKDYLMTYGISSNRMSVLSYGKERPVDSGSTPLAWSKNRRSVTVKAN